MRSGGDSEAPPPAAAAKALRYNPYAIPHAQYRGLGDGGLVSPVSGTATTQSRASSSVAIKSPFKKHALPVHLGVFHQWGLPGLLGQPSNLGLGITGRITPTSQHSHTCASRVFSPMGASRSVGTTLQSWIGNHRKAYSNVTTLSHTCFMSAVLWLSPR